MKNSVRVSLCAIAISIFGGITVDAQNITTVAGGGPPTTANAAFTRLTTSIGAPAAVRQDSLGNTYVLDNDLGRVYKIDTAGHVTLFAGNGTVGFSGDGGPAVNAAMDGPSGLCIDSLHNVYVADSDNAIIREIVVTAAGGKVVGNIYTVAGMQTETGFGYGGDGGSALGASLHFPDGCSFDSNDNLYIADRANNAVRVVIGATNVKPVGLAATTTVAGNIYLYTGMSTGATTPPAVGYGANGSPTVGAALNGPFDVFVDSHNNLFIADLGNPGTTANNVVREVPATAQTVPFAMNAGDIYTVAGVQGQTGVAMSGISAITAKLNGPEGLFVDANGNLFFCDNGNAVIREVAATTAGGNIVGDIYTVAGNGAQGYSGDGGPATGASLKHPDGTFVDATGNIYIADSVNDVIRLVTASTGDISTWAGNNLISYSNGTPATAAQLDVLAGLAINAAGDLAIADVGAGDEQSVIRGVASPVTTGALTTIVGSAGFSGFINVTTDPKYPVYVENNAIGVAFDASGNLYVADTDNCIVRKLSAGVMTTVAGVEPTPSANYPASTPNCGFAAQGGAAVGTLLGVVNGVALDAAGDIFFSDATNNVIWEVPKNTAGTMTAGNAYIVAGTQDLTGTFGGEGGVATAAHLNKPTGISFDVYGNLFIADTGNNIIREVPADSTATMTAGFIYTVAGDKTHQTAGYSGNGAAATSAQLNVPFTMAVDNAEDIFIADTNNNVIREVAGTTAGGKTKGDIYTVAGNPTAGANLPGFTGDGGPATSAELNAPQGLAIDGAGDLLIGDSQNDRVRSVAGIANVAAVPVASFAPSSLTFMSQPLTVKSTAQVVTLTNNGGATLTGIAITLGGTNAANFADTTTCTATLAAGANCSISVTFTPTVVGPASAALSIADSAIGSPQSIALNGTGQLGTPADVVTPNPIAFTPQLVGVASAALPVTLSNATGTGALVISSITFGGANTTDFSQTNNCGTTVAIGATCTINVIFNPTSATPPARAATLIITDNAADSPLSVPVTGTATAPAISITPTSLTFASQTVNTASAPQTVTIKNTGTGTLSFTGSGITIAGANATDFGIAAGDTCSAPLAAGATCTFNVVYNPAAAGTSTAMIVVADTVPSSPQLISLSGTATATPPALALTLAPAAGAPTSQPVTAGQTATYMLQISANQSASATITCSGAPTLATCTVPSSAVAVNTTPAPLTVTVSTTAATGMLAPQFQPTTRMQPPTAIQMLPLSVLAVLLMIVTLLAATQSPAGRLRLARVALSACLVLMPIAAATLLVGCGGGSSGPPTPTPTPGTPAGTYTITVTATSGSTKTTTQLTLVVQ